MKIKYMAWKQVISSDVNRLIYNTKGPGLHNQADQAMQNFNTLGDNPGLWRGFTDNREIPPKPGFDIMLENSVNPLNLWHSSNDGRNDPIKINHQIWDRKNGHEKLIIEPWYLGYMRILKQVLKAVIERDGQTNDASILYEYVCARLDNTIQIRTNLLQWIYDTQDGFENLELDTSFMSNYHLGDIAKLTRKYYYLVAKIQDGDHVFNVALMANKMCPMLHPAIRECLEKEKGGENLDVEVSAAPASPDAQRFLDALFSHRNIILYGPPGTGKTHMLMELSRSFNSSVMFDDLDTESPFRVTESSGDTAIEWCTFHPNYTYESFVHGLDPVIVDDKLGFKPHVGPLVRMALNAAEGKKSLLIIDEINRANTDAVFGDAIAVIDTAITDSVSFVEPIKLDNGRYITGVSSSENLFVVGTMNSLDKSTSPLSPELRRRFTIVELAPSVEILRSYLQRKNDMPDNLIKFTCSIMKTLNEKIHDFCGKEYEFGQGYFWGLVEATDDYENTLADILRNKILPHLKDILPPDCLSDFFGYGNLNVLYNSSATSFELANYDLLSNSKLLNAFAVAVGCSLMLSEASDDFDYCSSLEDYESKRIKYIQQQLDRNKNVILSGCSGTGKTYYISKLLESGVYPLYDKTHWHGSTEYSDAIEGIGVSVSDDNKSISYTIRPGIIRKLAENSSVDKRLMVIESVNKCNAAECFGELITLLEPDKRDLHIRGYEGDIKIPNNMYFLCTMNLSTSSKRLDSALKRRFVILEFEPDYKALSLHFHLVKDVVPTVGNLYEQEEMSIMALAVGILRSINQRIIAHVGKDMQIGQACIWNLKEKPTVENLLNLIDDNMLFQIEELCVDESIASGILGVKSPLIIHHSYGIEIGRLSSLTPDETIDAIREMLTNE